MGTHLGKPVAMPYVEERDILLLAADLGAGHFTADQLHSWYGQMIAEDGREPVSKKAFGLALKEAGLKSAVRRVGDEGKPARCWLITLPWQRRGEELLAQEKREADDRG
jgi:hypothetical protein